MKNNQKGITLVALVITIIVLLILAGVTIASLSGEDGLLTKSSKAVNQTSQSTEKETVLNTFNTAMAEWYDARYVANSYDQRTAVSYVVNQMLDKDEYADFNNIAKIYSDEDCTEELTASSLSTVENKSLSEAWVRLEKQKVRYKDETESEEYIVFHIETDQNAAKITDETDYSAQSELPE